MAAVMCAAMVASCGSNQGYKIGVSKGDKSTMDSLSYAYGVSFANDMLYNVPELKFDWEVLAAAAAESMLKDAEYEADEDNKPNLEILENFFTTKRPERIEAFLKENPVDSLDPSPMTAHLAKLDVFENDEERKSVSAAYGYDLGARFRAVRLPLEAYWFAQGILEYNSKAGSKFPSDEAMNIINTYHLNVMPKLNKEASEQWLAEVEKQRGVKKTESGLLYRIENEGDVNNKPGATDIVKVDYEGKLRDGVVFDSSYERGEAIEFQLNAVIKGWTEGVQLIGKGGKITLWIPADLAYGANTAGLIGPYEALQFDVELHEITSAAVPAPEATEDAQEQPAE